MAIRGGNPYFLDTNILLAASNTERAEHPETLELFRAAKRSRVLLALSGQILREYLVVATRPVSVNGFGLPSQQALMNCRWFRSQTIFLEESESSFEVLADMVEKKGIVGKRIHDANIAALMMSHRLDSIITLNPGDFQDLGLEGAYSPAQVLARF